MADDETIDHVKEEDIFMVPDDLGRQYEFKVTQIVAVDGHRYVSLSPVDPQAFPDFEEDEVLIMRIAQEDGEEVLVEIEDDEEFGRAVDAFSDLLDEEDEADTEQ